MFVVFSAPRAKATLFVFSALRAKSLFKVFLALLAKAESQKFSALRTKQTLAGGEPSTWVTARGTRRVEFRIRENVNLICFDVLENNTKFEKRFWKAITDKFE